jgi:hypothetical protein
MDENVSKGDGAPVRADTRRERFIEPDQQCQRFADDLELALGNRLGLDEKLAGYTASARLRRCKPRGSRITYWSAGEVKIPV